MPASSTTPTVAAPGTTLPETTPAPQPALNPCAELSAPGEMCRTVATAPIENANYSNPISVAITTSPSIELRIGTESGNIARHSVYPGSTSGSGGTGPSGNFPTKQDEFLTAVTDLTGDGRPEIIIETGQFPDHAEHQVLQLTDDGLLTVLPAPTYSMWTKGLDVWTSYRTSDAGMYRCPTPGQPGVTITPIQSIVINDDGSGTLTEYLYNDTARTWTQTEQTPYLTQPGVTALPSTSLGLLHDQVTDKVTQPVRLVWS